MPPGYVACPDCEPPPVLVPGIPLPEIPHCATCDNQHRVPDVRYMSRVLFAVGCYLKRGGDLRWWEGQLEEEHRRWYSFSVDQVAFAGVWAELKAKRGWR
jgi:hypothetical protein